MCILFRFNYSTFLVTNTSVDSWNQNNFLNGNIFFQIKSLSKKSKIFLSLTLIFKKEGEIKIKWILKHNKLLV